MEINDKLKTELKKVIKYTEIFDKYGTTPHEIGLKNYSDDSFSIILGEYGTIKESSYKSKPVKLSMHTHPIIVKNAEDSFMQHFSPGDLDYIRFHSPTECIIYRKEKNDKLDYYIKCLNPKNITQELYDQYKNVYNTLSQQGMVFENDMNEELNKIQNSSDLDNYMKKLEEAGEKNKNFDKNMLASAYKKLYEIEKELNIETQKISSKQHIKTENIDPIVSMYYFSPNNKSFYVYDYLSHYNKEDFLKLQNQDDTIKNTIEDGKSWKKIAQQSISNNDYSRYEFYDNKNYTSSIFFELYDILKRKSSYSSTKIKNKRNNNDISLETILENTIPKHIVMCVQKDDHSHKKCYNTNYSTKMSLSKKLEKEIEYYPQSEIEDIKNKIISENRWY